MTEDLLSSYTRPVKAPERTIVGRETEMRRVKAALMRPELCNVMLLADAGSGKANPVDTPVPVFDSRGIARLGDLRPGNYVFDENGRPVRVLHVFPQGVIPAYEVEFEDGRTCICNDGHLWNVRTEAERKSGDEYKTVTLRYLSKGFSDFPVYIPRGGNIGWPERDFAIHPYVMGIRIGLAYRAGFDKSGPVLSPDVLDLIRKLGGVRDAEELVRLVPLDGGRIPPEYMTGAVSQRYDLLAGVMDVAGDLSLDGNLVSVSLRSDGSALFGDIRDLAATAGWHMRLRGDTLSFAVHWGNICCVFRRRDYRDRIKAAIARWDGNYPFEPDYRDLEITTIRSLDMDLDMVCIYVDSREHLFRITRSGLVTHNTALVQGLMVEDSDRKYLEVDLSRMIADSKDSNEMAAKLKLLFDQVAAEVKTKRQDIVLFIDEFHQIVQLSAAAVEALKPLLADSGTRGIRVIAATTYIEFRKYISPNQPLVERLQRINLPEPDKKTVVAILKGMADRYGVGGLIIGDGLYDLIYEYTNRYIPANAQPRKSILVLDAMIGWYRSTGRSLDDRLLADVLYESEGVNVAFRVNASDIRAQLDKRVLSQKFATKMIEQRLQICIADLNNKKRPMSSFLLSGASGTGKTEVTKTLAETLFGSEDALLRFDMTEFANPDSLERFRTELTNRVWARPFSIVLLDEIEKACAPVTRLLLQVLDDGRLSDENNRIVSFLNCYIVMTTNAGSEVYKNIGQYNVDDEGSGDKIMEYYKVIRESIMSTTGDNKFPPELLGRIDVIVPFQPLSEETMKKIAVMNLKKMMASVKRRHNVDVAMDKRVVRYLVEDNLDTDADSGGARVVISKMESEVTIPIAKYINEHPRVRALNVRVDGTLVRDDPSLRVSDARVVVTEDTSRYR